jgi:hypothetical protein
MSENKFTAADLDEEFHQMTREELLDEIAIRIESYQEMLVLNYKERRVIQDENKELKEALIHGTNVVESAARKMSEYDVIIKNGTKTILMWRNTCYLLVIILIIVALVLTIK